MVGGNVVRSNAEQGWDAHRDQIAQVLAANPRVSLLELANTVGVLSGTDRDTVGVREVLQGLVGTPDEARIRDSVAQAIQLGTRPSWDCSITSAQLPVPVRFAGAEVLPDAVRIAIQPATANPT